jgi:hypothetical protein
MLRQLQGPNFGMLLLGHSPIGHHVLELYSAVPCEEKEGVTAEQITAALDQQIATSTGDRGVP